MAHADRRPLALMLLFSAMTPGALAGGPRYVTGPPFFTANAGQPVGWQQPNLFYFTDSGSLNASMTHQASDALIAAAAGVWNLPVASITVGQGGELAEHVSTQNTYMGANGMVYPADVMSANAAAIPIAILYDTDGSITETLLGSGASNPSECEQNAVTESVDAFDPAGYILHAVILLNGRCTGAAPQQLLQMQYQLERVFGRVLGLAWSQTNDNVFTGSTTPTYAEEQNWPIMHPIDILCGSYSYQCLVNPFQLRPDDIASMVAVYPIAQNTTPAAGKQSSLNNATALSGEIFFPDGEGMEGVNVLVRRQGPYAVDDGWYETSGVTGARFRRAGVPSFVSAGVDALSSMGTTDLNWPGYYIIPYIPMETGQTGVNLIVSIEPVNALYSGTHSLGPYQPGNVTLSGSAFTMPTDLGAGEGGWGGQSATVVDAASACGNGADGTATTPMQAPATGWWNGLLCGYGHMSYVAADVKPHRTFTVEVTALDANGYATINKAMPVIAVFAPGDGATPSLALQATAFQAWGMGTTTTSASTGALTNVTLGIADERGDGRPDYAYQARMFYADSVTPATIATGGATLTITGSGFRSGNAVSINGVRVSVLGWTANTVVLTAPAMSAVGALANTAVDVEVSDTATGATTTMTAALTYDSGMAPNAMRVVSIPQAEVFAGDAATVPFTVQVVKADGVTPVAGDTVVFSSTGGASFGSCGAASCSVTTNASGMATETVTTTVAGTVAITAADGAVQQSGSFPVEAQAGSITVLVAPQGAVNVGVQAQDPYLVVVRGTDGNPMPYESVTFSVTAGSATFGACNGSLCTVSTAADGTVAVLVTPQTTGPITLAATVGNMTQSISFTGASNVDTMVLVSGPPPTLFPLAPALFSIQLLHPNGSPDSGEAVTFSAPAGVLFEACQSNVCVMTTDNSGSAGLPTRMAVAGTYPLTASYGGVTRTVSMTVVNHAFQLNLVSVPANNAAPYLSTATPFAVQLVEDGSTPVAGVTVEVTGVQGDIQYDACGLSVCMLTTDANGMAATTVTPLIAGTVVLNAVSSSMAVTTSFTVQGGAETIRTVLQPGSAGLQTGVANTLLVQLMGVDGVTPLSAHWVTFTVLSGPYAFTRCQSTICEPGPTGADGITGVAGIASGAGPVTIQVTDVNQQASQLIQFNAYALPDVLNLVSTPASGGYVGTVQTVPFAVQAFFNDGVTPVSGRLVTISVTNGQATFAACNGASTCVLTADTSGMISTLVTPLAAGSITLAATDGAVTVSSTFTAVPKLDTMVVTVRPASNVYVGSSTTFTVKVLEGDGVTPRSGASVVFQATAGNVQWGICGVVSCTVTTAADGSASVTLTPSAAGAITVQAVDGALWQAVSFTAVGPDQLLLVSAPAPVLSGVPASLPFAVEVTLADGLTPVAGVAVTFTQSSANGATVIFNVCGAGACTLTTGANGVASTTVRGGLAGSVTLSATANLPTGAASLTAALTVLPNQHALTTQNGTVYVAEAAAVPLTLSATALENGIWAMDQPVTWAATGSLALAARDTLTNAIGVTTTEATLGPLAAGAQALATACAWTNVCVSFGGVGVAAASLQPVIASGAQQAIHAASYAPVTVQVTDGNGHAVVGAAVSVYQTVSALDASCPAQGRCPAAPVLASNAAVMVSASDGTVTFTPMTALSVASSTEIAVSVGTQGFATTILTNQP